MTRFATPLVLAVSLTLGACDRVGSGNDAEMVTPEPQVANVAVAKPPAASDSPLLPYRGKYPSDQVDGVAFFDQPSVRAAMNRAVGAGQSVTAKQLLALDGPETPIGYADGMLTAWRCEAHICGPHNWTLMISLDGRRARLCYHDETAKQPNRWFADGRALAKTDDCPSES